MQIEKNARNSALARYSLPVDIFIIRGILRDAFLPDRCVLLFEINFQINKKAFELLGSFEGSGCQLDKMK